MALFGVGYHYRFFLADKIKPYTEYAKQKFSILSGANPCLEPIPYVLGSFDTDFKISEKYFLSALTEAEEIWEKPLGKNLFFYTPADPTDKAVKVNLVYDYRQQATSKLANLGIVVQNTRASYESLETKFNNLKTEYETDKNIFNRTVEDFNEKTKTYESEVTNWNAKGGAPQKEYERLQAIQKSLESESKQIGDTQKELSNRADDINAMVVVLNRLIESLNLSVAKYNTTNDARGETFEEGVYTSDGETREIDVYEFSSKDKLVRVLAHEFGHALGLEHIPDETAIMYELNHSDSLTPSEEDIKALKAKFNIST